MDIYVAAFLARCRRAQRAEQRLIDAPGLHGLGPSASGRVTLLVTDDQARDTLLGLMRDGRAGTVRVAANAPRCGRLLHDAGWTATPVTAMIRRELRTLPSAPLPDELQLRDVDREAQGARDRVALADAVALAVRADPRIVESPDAMTDLLRSLPAVHLLAAVDLSGVVRATSGARVHDADATVFFVNTDPACRRRGVGRAMTAAALQAARGLGAMRACLDATESGRSIYERLGFEVVTRVTQFSAPTS